MMKNVLSLNTTTKKLQQENLSDLHNNWKLLQILAIIIQANIVLLQLISRGSFAYLLCITML